MKSQDQQMLEEAYNDVIKNMMAGANNPGWTPERAFASGQAFKPWEPQGGWPRKKEMVSMKQAAVPKKQQQPAQEEEEFDVEGDAVGDYQHVAAPQPEEDHTDSMMFVSNADMEKVFHHDASMFERLFQDAEAAVEQDGGIVFRYVAPRLRLKMQQEVDAVVHK
jgi:hypothetical protein